MPLARYAMYAWGVQIYVAPTWDSSDNWVGTMQHIAREGRCRRNRLLHRDAAERNPGVATSSRSCTRRSKSRRTTG